MPGFDTATQIAVNNNGTYSISNLGDWVESFFSNSSFIPVQESPGVQSIDVTGQPYTILNVDCWGTITYTPVTAVVKYTVADMSPSPSTIEMDTQFGKKIVCASDALLATRINNQIGSQVASAYNVGDYLTTGMMSFIQTGSPPNVIVQEVQYEIDYGTPIAHVITNTWGDNNFSRYDCQNCLQVLQNNPDLDQTDAEVLNDAIGENTEYDLINTISSTTPGTYLYDIRTQSGDYQMLTGFNTGTPVVD